MAFAYGNDSLSAEWDEWSPSCKLDTLKMYFVLRWCVAALLHENDLWKIEQRLG